MAVQVIHRPSLGGAAQPCVVGTDRGAEQLNIRILASADEHILLFDIYRAVGLCVHQYAIGHRLTPALPGGGAHLTAVVGRDGFLAQELQRNGADHQNIPVRQRCPLVHRHAVHLHAVLGEGVRYHPAVLFLGDHRVKTADAGQRQHHIVGLTLADRGLPVGNIHHGAVILVHQLGHLVHPGAVAKQRDHAHRQDQQRQHRQHIPQHAGQEL